MAESTVLDFLQQLPTGFIAMFCFAAVALAGSLILIVNLRARRAQTRAVQAAPASMPLMAYTPPDMPDLDALLSSQPAPAPVRSSRSGTQTITMADGSSTEAIELLTVMRDITGGGLIVQINDKAYPITKDMRDHEFRQRMLTILRELAQNAGSGPSQPLQGVSASPPASAAPAETAPPRVTEPPPIPTSPAFDLPRYSLENQTTPMTRRDLKKAYEQPIPELDIAGRIEAFLQHKLSVTHTFPGRVIHVRSAPNGGIRIEVDGQAYEAVDDVSDEEVRAFLKAAIQEWQDRQ
jgi:hypothetical protein